MVKLQEFWNKKEKENLKKKKWEDKVKKKEECKVMGGIVDFDSMIVYVDENGNIIFILLDLFKRIVVNVEDIELGVFFCENEDIGDGICKGIVFYFDLLKGYGFIKDFDI